MAFLYDIPDYGPDHWTRVYEAMAKVRTPGGLHLSQQAASVFVTDPRYLAFSDLISPVQWMAASQPSTFTSFASEQVTYGGRIQQVVARLLAAGPEPALMRARPDLTREAWRERVLRVYENLEDEAEEDVEDEPELAPSGYVDVNRPPARQERPETSEEDESGTESQFEAPDSAARRWSRGKGLPSHNPQRRSQSPVGRHERLTSDNARKWGVSEPEAHLRMKCEHSTCKWHK